MINNNEYENLKLIQFEIDIGNRCRIHSLIFLQNHFTIKVVIITDLEQKQKSA